MSEVALPPEREEYRQAWRDRIAAIIAGTAVKAAKEVPDEPQQ